MGAPGDAYRRRLTELPHTTGSGLVIRLWLIGTMGIVLGANEVPLGNRQLGTSSRGPVAEGLAFGSVNQRRAESDHADSRRAAQSFYDLCRRAPAAWSTDAELRRRDEEAVGPGDDHGDSSFGRWSTCCQLWRLLQRHRQ
jgi:hypothetical protein